MELPKLVIIGLTVIGLGGILLAGYVVYRLSIRTPAQQPPDAVTMPVPEREETPSDNVIGFKPELRSVS